MRVGEGQSSLESTKFFLFSLLSFLTLSIFAMNLICSCSCASIGSDGAEIDDEVKAFNGDGPDFSFSYPAIWIAKTSSDGKNYAGSSAEGSLELVGSCERFSLNWTRDPGISPEMILDQIEKTYNSEDVKVISARRSTITLDGSQAEAMSILYELNGYRSAKKFAVWNLSSSDRLFLASISRPGCSPELGQSEAIFDSLVASFSDLEKVEIVQMGPKRKDDAWTLVLGDLLSSYHYIAAKTLPARSTRVQVLHRLSPVNGTYELDSREEIHVDLPEAAAKRAWAVQSLLIEEGYDARLAQRSGEMGVAALDPTGRWQLISVNPAKPGKSVGVLANGTKEAPIYNGPEELAEANRMNPQDLDIFDLMVKDCDPSLYVELKQPYGMKDVAGTTDAINTTDTIDTTKFESWLGDLEEVLDSYDYDKDYKENVFDCSNTSQICWSVLQGKGYDARLMMSWNGQPLGPHMWVVVGYPLEDESYVAVETANTNGHMELVHLGRVVKDDDYYRGIMYNTSAQYSRLHPEEGMWLVDMGSH